MAIELCYNNYIFDFSRLISFILCPQQDAVRKAQTAFTAVYGCTYPLCSNVQMGLREIFQCTYRGSQQDFEAYFVQPTLDLLNHLTEKV